MSRITISIRSRFFLKTSTASSPAGHEHFEPGQEERLFDHFDNGLLIIDQKNRFFPAQDFSGQLFLFRNLHLGCGEINVEGAPKAHFAVDRDEPSMVLDDAVNRSQAQARSPAHLLGGKEGFEDSVRGLLVHPDPGIPDRYADVSSRLHGKGFYVVRPESDVLGLQIEVPPSCMACQAFT